MPLGREKLEGEPIGVDHPKFMAAARVAAIEEELAAAPEAPRWSFDRRHVEELRQAGAARDDVAEYLRTLFNPKDVSKLLTDLDSYGPWPGDDEAA